MNEQADVFHSVSRRHMEGFQKFQASLHEFWYNSSILHKARENKKPTSFALACGPAVKWAGLAVFLVFFVWLIVPFVAYHNTDCDEKNRGIQTCHGTWIMWVIVAFLFVPQWYAQLICFRQVVLNQLAEVDYKICCGDLGKLGNTLLFGTLSGFTCLSLVDVLTNAQVLGRIMATYSKCPSQEEHVARFWHMTMMRSMFSANPDFWFIAFVVYSMQVILPLVAIIYSVPRNVCRRRHRFKASYISYADDQPLVDLKVNYTTMFNCTQTSHAKVAMLLSTLAGFGLVTFLDMSYISNRLERYRREEENDRDGQWRMKYLKCVLDPLERGMARFFLLGLYRNAIQNNLQISVAGINQHLNEGKRDPQLMFSIFISWFSTCLELPDIISTLMVVSSGFSWYCLNIDKSDKRGFKWFLAKICQSDEEDANVRWVFKRILVNYAMFIGFTFVYICFVVWSLVKFFGLFVCKEHLINIPSGCVAQQSPFLF